MSTNRKTVDEWITFRHKSNKNIVFYQEKVLDLTSYMSLHPGGKKALMNYLNKDVTNILFTVFPHKRDTTLSILMKYVIGSIPRQDSKPNPRQLTSRSPTPIKDKKKVCFQSGLIQKGVQQILKINISKLKGNKSTKEIKTSEQDKQKSRLYSQKKENRQQSKSIDKKIKKQTQIKPTQPELSKDSSESINSDLDEEKPIFKVPILQTKNIFLQ